MEYVHTHLYKYGLAYQVLGKLNIDFYSVSRTAFRFGKEACVERDQKDTDA